MSDSYATIKIAANHNKLILVRNQHLAAGNANSVFIQVDLRTDDWIACDKLRLVFNDYYIRKLDSSLVCDIPPEVMAIPGEFSVNLYGIDGNMRMSTSKIKFLVEEGTFGGGLFPDIGEIDPDNTYVFDGGFVHGNQTEEDFDRLIIYDGGGVHGY